MRCSEIIERLRELAPETCACDWDNPGLLAGRHDKEVKRIYIALDATDTVVERAVTLKADMLLTHHPLIFKAVKQINDQNFITRRILRLIQADISYFAMHTNYDVMGMAELSADYLKLKERQVLSVTAETEQRPQGFGRVGKLPEPMSLKECALYVKEALSLNDVRLYGEPEQMVETAAVCTGSGKSMIPDALKKGAQVYITGDIDHHTGIDATAQGLAVIDAGHYGTEYIFMEAVSRKLSAEFPELKVSCARIVSPYTLL